VNTGSQSGSKVGRARQHVAQMFVPHEFVAILLDKRFYFVESLTEPFENGADISILLHGYHSIVIFFIDPYQKIFLVIVPDSSSIRPISCHASTEKQWADRFVEKKAVSNQLILVCFSHRC